MRERKTSKTSKHKGKRTPARKRGRATKKYETTRSKGRPKKPLLSEIPTQLDHARRLFMVTKSIKHGAQNTGISESRLRRLIRNYKLARWDRSKRKWILTDRVTREVGIASNGRAKTIVVRGFSRAQAAKGYTAAVKRFLETNDVAVLAPYEGQTISDVKKHQHPLETRPNVLLRLANTGGDAEMKIYRLLD